MCRSYDMLQKTIVYGSLNSVDGLEAHLEARQGLRHDRIWRTCFLIL